MRKFLLGSLFPDRSILHGGPTLFANDLDGLILHPVFLDRTQLRTEGLHSLDALHAATEYAAVPELRRALYVYKYDRVPTLAPHLAALMLRASSMHLSSESAIVPIPLHWIRRFWRGFNQAELLASEIAQTAHHPLEHLLRRTRPTRSQARREGEERRRAMDHAFRCTTENVPPHIVLIDDVATTGATLDDAARALKERGALRVEGWVLAKG